MTTTAEQESKVINIKDIPAELHRRVKIKVAEEGRTIRDVVLELLEGYVRKSK